MDSTGTVSRVERSLFIFGEISDLVAGQVIQELHTLELTEGDIFITLQSNGGEEPAGYAIYDAISMCRNRVIITGIGEISSIAAAIFQAADWRRLTPNATFMIHHGDVRVDEGGRVNQDDIVELAKGIEKDNKKYYNILCKRSLQPEETVRNWCLVEEIFTAQEAFNVGFCDELVIPYKNKVKAKSKKEKK